MENQSTILSRQVIASRIHAHLIQCDDHRDVCIKDMPEDTEYLDQSKITLPEQAIEQPVSTISLSHQNILQLLDINHPVQFIRQSYLLILARPADVAGEAYHMQRLSAGCPKPVILHQLLNSTEFKARQLPFEIPQSIKTAAFKYHQKNRIKQLIRKIPLVSRLAFIAYRLITLPRHYYRSMDVLNVRLDQLTQTAQEQLEQTHKQFEQILGQFGRSYQQINDMYDDHNNQFKQMAHEIKQSAERHVNVSHYHYEKLAGLLQKVNYSADTLLGQITQLLQAEHDIGKHLSTHLEHARGEIQHARQELQHNLKEVQQSRHDIHQNFTITQHIQQQVQQAQQQIQQVYHEIEVTKSKQVIYTGEEFVLLKTLGYAFCVPAKDYQMISYLTYGQYWENGLAEWFKRNVTQGMCIVDIGANIGIYTLIAAHRVGADGYVYSFEPTPRIFQLLTQNVEMNGFKRDNVVLSPLAVFDHATELNLIDYENNCGHNHLFNKQETGDSHAFFQVSTTDLDHTACAQHKIDIIKIDAEGAEPFILRGMQTIINNNPDIKIIIEFAPSHLQRAQVDPAAFIDEITHTYQFSYQLINDHTGELTLITQEQLLSSFSANLLLTKTI